MLNKQATHLKNYDWTVLTLKGGGIIRIPQILQLHHVFARNLDSRAQGVTLEKWETWETFAFLFGWTFMDEIAASLREGRFWNWHFAVADDLWKHHPFDKDPILQQPCVQTPLYFKITNWIADWLDDFISFLGR